METKLCYRCQRTKPITEFGKDAQNKTGHHPRCRECSRYYHLYKKYGLTLEDYGQLVDQQNGVCALCFQECRTGQFLSVDHSHTTGKIRGLLCRTCNSLLGYANEDEALLQRAIEYLRKSSSEV